MADGKQILQALEAADAAGDEESARELAALYKQNYAVPAEGSPFLQGVNKALTSTIGFIADTADLPFQAIRGVRELATGRDLNIPKPSATLDRLMVDAGVTYENIEDLSPDDQKWAMGGRVFGEGMAIATGVGALSTATKAAPLIGNAGGVNFGNIGTNIVRGFQQSPASVAATETAAVGLASGGRIAAEASGANEEQAIASEVGASLFNPVPALVFATRKLTNAATRLIPTERAMKAEFSRELGRLSDQFGADASQLANRLDAPSELSGHTSGSKTGDPMLIAIERTLAGDSADASRELGTQYRDALAEMGTTLKSAYQSGDPQKFQEALKIHQRRYTNAIQAHMANAERKAVETAEKMKPGNPSRLAINDAARETLTAALKEVRGIEKELWDAVPTGVEVEPVSLKSAYREALGEVTRPGESLGAPAPEFVTSLQADLVNTGLLNANGSPISRWEVPTTTSGNLKAFRTAMLNKMRAARASPNGAGDAHRYRLLAQGALDDLMKLDLPEFQSARAYSLALNNHFTRSEVGRVLRQDAWGDYVVDEGLTLERLMAGSQHGAVSNRDLMAAGSQLEGRGTDRTAALRGHVDDFMRHVVSRTVDENGRVNTGQLHSWRRDNADLLREYPELDALTENALAVERAAKSSMPHYETALKWATDKAAFARVAGVGKEAVDDEMRSLINGKHPSQDLEQVFRRASRHSEEASSGAVATFSRAVFGNHEMVPGAKALQTLEDYGQAAVRGGVMTPVELRRMKQIAGEAANLELAMSSKETVDTLISEVGSMNLIARILGANLGGMSAVGQMSGAPLVMALYGSQVAQRLLQKIPQGRVADVALAAAKDPELMADLLRKTKSRQAYDRNAKRVHAALVQAGIIEEDE